MKDTIKITIESGKGGDGIIAFDKARKADGGNGGKGGDVYVVGNSNVFDFRKTIETNKFKAEDGYRGEKNKRTGKNGKDLEIHIPLITKVLDSQGEELTTITKNSQRFRLLEGGQGGLGNFSLRSKGWDGKMSRTKGEDSFKDDIVLELNLKAHIVFLGYPNAGKSSLVNALSNAKYRVAPYEFTTLEPQLAVMDRYILMDLPGLIEGSYKGKGLGIHFLKHTKYSDLLVHCVSLENTDILKTYKQMRKEFKNISNDLYSMPELVVFTKADIYSEEELKDVKKSLKRNFKDCLLVSTFKKEDIEGLRKELKKRLSSISNTVI